jgi:GT2 family glycosyltransferase
MAEDSTFAQRNGAQSPPNFTLLGEPLRPALQPVGPLVSILIPCCGMLEYTKILVPSILRHTRPPFELVFIDIGSLDGTAEYLAGVATVHPSIRVEVVRTPTDLGIRDACDEGVGKARGDYLILLNNDTVVTGGWIHHLMGLLSHSPAMGLAGPMSNYVGGPQLVEAVPYRIGPKKLPRLEGRYGTSEVLVDVEAVEEFSRQFREENRAKWTETERLSGFCLMLKREVLLKTGPIDAWSDLNIFDTDQLCSKARQAGFKLAICRDLFIHHFGSRTFSGGAPERKANEADNMVVA